jgi:hypothetical protein
MIGDCDLIFDATANPEILNLVSAVAAFAANQSCGQKSLAAALGG